MIIAKFENGVTVEQVNDSDFVINVDGVTVTECNFFDCQMNHDHAIHDAREISEKIGNGIYAVTNGAITLSPEYRAAY